MKKIWILIAAVLLASCSTGTVSLNPGHAVPMYTDKQNSMLVVMRDGKPYYVLLNAATGGCI